MEQDKQKRKKTIYSTAVINQLIDDYQQGYDIDYTPFFMRDTQLRAENIPFKMTEEEMEEYQKCYDDPVYYAEKYAKFQTDKGRELVDLREYQKKVIRVVTEEDYDEENDLVYPTNRSVIWLASRQVGKCQFFGSNIDVCDNKNHSHKILIGEYYDNVNNERKSLKKRILCKLKKILYKIYIRI